MHVSLIVPAPFDAVSGGYAYDRRIVAGLREAGHGVQVIELAGAYPLADEAARDAARAAWDASASVLAADHRRARPAGLRRTWTMRWRRATPSA